jgi:hypothetical protein
LSRAEGLASCKLLVNDDRPTHASFTPSFAKFSKTGAAAAMQIDQRDLFQANGAERVFFLRQKLIAVQTQAGIE